MFKNILRTFESEVLKIVKNIQPQPKNKGVLVLLKKNRVHKFQILLQYI